MTISLAKDDKISLSKEAPGLSTVTIGLGWDARTTVGATFDLDASALLVGENGKVRSDKDFIFYSQKSDAAGSVIHQGDNRTGAGDGDDEQITVNLSKVPADIERVVIVVSIDKAAELGLKFGQVRNSYVRALNAADGVEIAKYDLGEEVSSETAVIFAEIYRYNGEWKFSAVGQGYANGLVGVLADFGINIG